MSKEGLRQVLGEAVGDTCFAAMGNHTVVEPREGTPHSCRNGVVELADEETGVIGFFWQGEIPSLCCMQASAR